VPYFDSTVAPEKAEHVVAVSYGRGPTRPVWTQRITGEHTADDLVARLIAALASGWHPEHDPLPKF
jgi:hypothetical protein